MGCNLKTRDDRPYIAFRRDAFRVSQTRSAAFQKICSSPLWWSRGGRVKQGELEPVQQVGLMNGMSGGHFIPTPRVTQGSRRPRLHKKAHTPKAHGLQCGAGGSRTPVQTSNKRAFYMLRRMLFFDPGQAIARQILDLVSLISPRP